MTVKDKKELERWARAAVHGLDQSAVFVGVLDDRPLDAARIAFTLQLGHAILTNKPIIIPVPHGVALPPKLAAIADRIVRYDPADPKTMQAGMVAALVALGINKQ